MQNWRMFRDPVFEKSYNKLRENLARSLTYEKHTTSMRFTKNLRTNLCKTCSNLIVLKAQTNRASALERLSQTDGSPPCTYDMCESCTCCLRCNVKYYIGFIGNLNFSSSEKILKICQNFTKLPL